VAAVILSAANKVRFINTMATNRFTGPQSGEVDMLVRNTTWTLGREASPGLEFASINFYDGTGFMVKTASGVTSVRGWTGRRCACSPARRGS
jgi:general L-amino acid transport system substrate-binding protein